MATETIIPDLLHLEKVEREEDVLSSEIVEEKVTGNKLEISSHVAETVNTQIESGTLTSESGTFFQALSVPTVNADDVTSSQDATNEDVKEITTGQHATTAAYVKEQDLNERPSEISKEVTEDKSFELQEANEKCENGGNDKEEQTFEESVTEKVAESKEGLTLSENSSIMQNVIETESKDDDQEKDKVVYVSEKGQGGGDDVTSSQDAIIEDIEETTVQHATTIDPQEDQRGEKAEESVNKVVETCLEVEKEEDTEEIKPSVEIEEKEQQGENEVKSDDGLEKRSDNLLVKETCEETIIEKVEYEEEVKHSDSSNVEINEKTTASLRKDEESIEDDIKETAFQNDTRVAYIEEGKIPNAASKDIPKEEEVEDDVQSASKKSENGAEEERLEKQDEDSQQVKPIVETEDKTKQGLLHDAKVDDCITAETESGVESLEHEVKSDEAIQSDYGQIDSPLVKEACEETGSEKVEYTKEVEEEIDEEAIVNEDGQSEKSESPLVKEVCEAQDVQKVESEEGFKDFEILSEKELVGKEENEEKGQELKTSEEVEGGGDDVICSQDASSEDVKETTIGQHATTVVNFEEGRVQSVMTKEIIKEEAEDKSIDAQEEKGEQKPEESVIKTGQSSSETEHAEEIEEIKPRAETGEETESVIETAEHEEKSDEGQQESFDHPTVKEVCEETGSEKVEHKEEVKEAKIENEIVTKVEDEEKEQEVYVSENGQGGGDDVTTSQDATFEDIKETTAGEDVAIVACFKEGQALSLMPKEILEEEVEHKSSDAQEASNQYSNEAKDKIEQTTSSGVETKENEEKIEEETIVNTDGQTKKSESPLDKEVCEAPSSEKVEFEEGMKDINSSSTKLNEDEIASKEENEEKEQELKMSEQVEGGEDDVIISQNAPSEDIKESNIGQPATTLTYEEGQDHSAIPKEIITEAVEDKSIDAREASEKCDNGAEDQSEQKREEIVDEIIQFSSETEHKKDTEEIKPGVEIEEETEQQGLLHSGTTDERITETESQADSAGYEVKIDEAIRSDDGQKESFDSPSVTEACEEVGSEKVEYKEEASEQYESEANNEIEQKPEESIEKSENTEETKPNVETYRKEQVHESDDGRKENSDNPSIKEAYEETNSKEVKSRGVELFGKDEDQEKEQECVISEEDQGKDDVTCSQDASIEEDTEEVKYSVETKECEEKIDEEAIVNDYGQKKEFESPLVKEVCKVISSENVVESEEELKHFESSSKTLNQDELVSKEDNQEKEQEPKEVEGGGDDFISPQNASSEDIKESVIDQHVTTTVDFKEGRDHSAMTEEILREEATDKSSDAHQDKQEQKLEESLSQIVESCPEIEHKENFDEIKQGVETEEKIESQIESVEHEVKIDEAIQGDEGQKESFDHPSTKEVCEETSSEKVEYSAEVTETTTENEIVTKVEDEEKGQEASVDYDGQTEKSESPLVEEVCEVTESEKAESELNKNETKSKEEIQETKIGQHDTTVAYFEEGQDHSEMTKEIIGEEGENKKIDAKENEKEQKPEESVNPIAESCSKIEQEEDTDIIKPSVKTEQQGLLNPVTADDCITSQTESQVESAELEVNSSLVNEVSEETSSDKVEYSEEVKETTNENELVTKVEDEEKGQGGGDDVTISQDEPIEDIKEKTVGEDVTSVAYVEEGHALSSLPKEILKEEAVEKSSDDQETTKTEEKGQEAIVNDDGQTEKSESPFVKEVCEEPELKKNVSEEGIELSGSSDVNFNEKEIAILSKDEDQEKEQELHTPEKDQGEDEEGVKAIEILKDEDQEKDQVAMSAEGQGKDNVTSSEVVASEEDLQEKKYQEPELVTSGESIKEDTEDIKSSVELTENTEHQGFLHAITGYIRSFTETDAKEDTMEKKEEIEEEAIVNNDCQTEEETIKKKEKIEEEAKVNDDGQTEEEPLEKKEKIEEEVKVNDDGQTEEEIVEKEEKIEEEVRVNDDGQTEEETKEKEEKIEEEVKVNDVCQTEEEIVEKKEKINEEVSLELGQPIEQNVDVTKTVSENTEDEITKKDENLSHESVEDVNGTTTKEEKCFVEERREVELVEEQKGIPDEVSEEKSKDHNETTEVEPQVDIIPSSSIGNDPNSENATVENEILPIEDLESVSEVVKDAQIAHEDLEVAEKSVFISEEVKDDKEDEAPKEERISTPEDAVTLEPQANFPKIESEESPKQAIESEVVAESDDLKVQEECIVYGDEESDNRTDEILSAETTESKEVTEHPSISSLDTVLDKENLELHGELKPTFESVIQEDQAKETKPEPEIQSDIASESIMKHTSEKDLADEKRDMEEDVTPAPINQNDTIKNVVLTDEVAEETEKEKENNEVKGQVSEEDICATELDKTSESNEKELTDEVLSELGQPKEQFVEEIQAGPTKTVSEIIEDEITKKEENLEDTKDDAIKGEKCLLDEKTRETELVEEQSVGLDEVSEEKSITEGEPQEDVNQNLELHEELKPITELVIEEDQVKETKPQSEQSDIISKEYANQKELANEKEYSKPIPPGTTEVTEVKAESTIELENTQGAETPNLEFEKNEKDDEMMISEKQIPEVNHKTEVKEELLEATNNTCEMSEKKLVSMVQPEELSSPKAEDQTDELVLETDKTKVECSSISNKDQKNLEFTEEESTTILVIEEKTLEKDANKEKETVGESQGNKNQLEDKPTEVYEITSEVTEIVPEPREVSTTLPENTQESSRMIEKNDLESTTEAIIADVVNNAECSEIQQQHLSTLEASLESIEQENQSGQKKEADEHIESEILTKKELDAPVTTDNATKEELEISQKHVTDDLIKISQMQPELQKIEDSDCTVDNQSHIEPHQNESIERKILITEPEDKASGTKPQCSSDIFKEEKKTRDEKEKSPTAEQMEGNSEVDEKLIEERETALKKDEKVDKEETGDKGAKTDEENEEEDDEDNQMIDAPVMVEASKDIEVKTPKKSHNILSGVGSKVKHSIAKVKKAITGKSSHPKPSSPKEKDQVIA